MKFVYTLFITLLFVQTAVAQPILNSMGKSDTTKSTYHLGNQIFTDVKKSVEVTGKYFTNVGNFQWYDWTASAAVIGGTVASIYLLDKPMQTAFQSNTLQGLKSSINPLLQIGEYYGRFYIWLGAAAVGYAIGAIAQNDEVRIISQNVLESIGLTSISVVALKIVFGRSRPFMNEGTQSFNMLQFNEDKNSFPSFHVATAFSLATVLTIKTKKWWIAVPLYLLSALTVFERMYNNQHWASDVLLGAAIGMATGLFVGLCSNDAPPPPPPSQSLIPSYLNQTTEILRMSFLIPYQK